MSARDAFGGVDPLPALWVERCRLDAEYIGMPDDIADDDPRVLAINARLDEIDDQLDALVPASAAGAAVLVRYLKHRMVGFLWDETHDRIADNLIAGLERLGRGGTV
jgi:hypothetical protein